MQKRRKQLRTLLYIFTCAVFTLLSTVASAQVTFSGLLLSKNDSLPMAFANVKLVETDKYTATNEKGEFTFVLTEAMPVVHFEVAAIGCHTTIAYKPAYAKQEKVYAEQLAAQIKEIEIRGYTAKSVVKKAVQQIPQNYADTSYIAASFYREYQKVNGHFKNLIEAQMSVAFNISRDGNKLLSKEAFMVPALRRSNFKYDIKDFSGDGCMGLLHQNPIYYLTEGSLNPKAFDDYEFSFDTLQQPNVYVINYVCRYTSDKHGVENYFALNYKGEAREYGKLFIDKESFAVISFERLAVRNKKYGYPNNNNFLQPSMEYTGEFLEGKCIADYYQFQGKWYLKKLVYSYSNEYFRTGTYVKDYTITSSFEWYCASVKRSIPKDLLKRFYFTPGVSTSPYPYDKSKWENLPPFYFYKGEDVYKDLARKMPLEKQFEDEGKIDRK